MIDVERKLRKWLSRVNLSPIIQYNAYARGRVEPQMNVYEGCWSICTGNRAECVDGAVEDTLGRLESIDLE